MGVAQEGMEVQEEAAIVKIVNYSPMLHHPTVVVPNTGSLFWRKKKKKKRERVK